MKSDPFDPHVTHWPQRYVLLAAIWSALAIGSLAWDIYGEKQATLRTATAAVRANINKDIGFRKWATFHGGVYVTPTEHTPPNPYLKVPNRDVVTTAGQPLTLMNPAYMLREIQTDFPDDYGTRSQIVSLNPINPKNTADAWQAKALRSFEQGAKELLEIQQIDGRPYLRLMHPFVVEEGCLKCHGQQGYKLGDIRGGISSALPLEPLLSQQQALISGMALSHSAIWLVGLAGLGFAYRRDRRQADEREKAAYELRASEHRLKEAQRIAHLGSWDLDIAKNNLAWSAEIYRIFELDPEKFGASYDAFLNTVHPDDRALVDKAYNESVNSRTPYDIEHRLLMQDGRVKYVNEIGETYYGEDGKPLRSFGIVHDITERKLSEAALTRHVRDLGERIKEIECLRDVTFFLLDKKMDVDQVLEACARRIPTAWLDPAHTCARIRLGDRAYESANFRESERKLAAAISITGMGLGMIEVFYFGEWSNDHESPFLDGERTLIESLAIQVAQSLEKRLAEAELQEAQRIAHVGNWQLDAATNRVVWSEELYRMLGLDPKLPPPDYPEHHKLFTPESWERLDAALPRTREAGIPYELELEMVRANGKHGWMLARGEAVRGANNAIIGLHGVAIDITEHKLVEEKIRRINDELEQRVAERTAELESFAYSVSHDLRVPLRAIDGFSRMLLQHYEGKLDDEGKRLLNVVRDNTRRMGQLIDDILAFSRAGRLEIKASEVDMEALARDVWHELEPIISGRDVRLNIGALPKAQGDPAVLRQAWANLLGNAVKFTGQKPVAQIEISGASEGAECVYCVKDNGAGFDMQYANKLFGVFQRLHGINEFEGTGIGLAIVKRIVTRHGGRVWAEGKAGEGAEFCFTLPIPQEKLS